ncbi:MAG: BatD family protein [Candidatus Thiodiazotropha sp. (ex Myrtea spinifera)]|nr:BatD family protein [Candidatus Thiodiazotropha sp. (ex Myrtea spinifera)]MCU7827693.1 BatD family protein [Candidatus Thiodiazotropha sp. (ex Myrtea sp. 'scaly one' KF741663)]
MESGKRFTILSLAGLCLLVFLQPAATNPYAGRDLWQTLPPGQWTYAPPTQRQPTQQTQTQKQPKTQPVYGSWPGQQRPNYAQQTYYPAQHEKPYIESEVTQKNPYVQQGVILKLSVVSRHNLLTAKPRVPESDHYILQHLEGPTTYSRTHKGKREIVSDYFYELTPLRAGALAISGFRVTGEAEQVSGYNRSKIPFDVTSKESVELQIRESNPNSMPWLPLEQLTLQVDLPTSYKAAAGKPLPVKVELTALGQGGNQLPSLEQQLKSEAFRVYREHSEVSTTLNKNNKKTKGRRVETFILVPQYGGDLKLPELSINWWNTRSNMPQRTSFPLQPIAVSGNRQTSNFFADDEESSLFPAGTSSAFWIPLSIVFGVIFGYWMAVWISHRRKGDTQISPLQPLVTFLQRPMRQMAPAFSPLKEKLRTAGHAFNPIARWHRWRRHLVGMLPLSVRFWFCVRFVDEESDPEIWGYTLRFLANKHMGLPINAPFSVIGKHILAFHPKAEPKKIHELIHQLEESIYGHHSLDFESWKAAFKHEIRPSMRLIPRSWSNRERAPDSDLPTLNPDRLLSR